MCHWGSQGIEAGALTGLYHPGLLAAKKELYRVLLKMPPAQLTDADASLMYELSQDPAIQSVLGIQVKVDDALPSNMGFMQGADGKQRIWFLA